ncbi:hypothetical protein CkaCkLH20_01253 [Colletotrichum karsti]|uniref:Uncharacterized protein n=1 Tax=Colletotrichum karsti TaxID=1095194 RepID=A0A9P6IDZ7_9PEZI|nr:uncharacterized protein CkaCkLH20_01253 [Colletotrichum karsti]KAF9881103.1 hypothetical protein CkaCkLH20_01253 [Colletotrichum karsti]
MIYREVLVSGRPIRPRSLGPSDNPVHLALFLTCRQVYHQACEILYKENCFAFGPGILSRHVSYVAKLTAPTGPQAKSGRKTKSKNSKNLTTAEKAASRNKAKWNDHLVPVVRTASPSSDINFFLDHVSRSNAKLIRHVQIRAFPWRCWSDDDVLEKEVRPLVSAIERLPCAFRTFNIIMPGDIEKSMINAMKPSKDMPPGFDDIWPEHTLVNPEEKSICTFLADVYKLMRRIRNVQEVLRVDHPGTPSNQQSKAKEFLRQAGWKNVGDIEEVPEAPHPMLRYIEKELGVDLRIWG